MSTYLKKVDEWQAEQYKIGRRRRGWEASDVNDEINNLEVKLFRKASCPRTVT